MLMNKKRRVKRLNNKGFAISSVLYSLLIMVFLMVIIMMGMMASNRKSTHKLVDQIEEELNRYSLSSTKLELDPDATTAEPKEYVVPTGQSGWYKIELWGASGGSTSSTTRKARTGGKGSYVSGVVYLEENETLYFYIGGTTTTSKGGVNGGGDGGSETGKGGGGSTDVRTIRGAWDQEESLQSRFLVAAGGGGADGLEDGSDGGNGGQIWGSDGGQNKAGDTYTPAGAGKQVGPTIWSFLNITSTTTVGDCNRAFYTDEDNKYLSGCGRLGTGGSSPIDRTHGGGGGGGYFGGGAGTSTTAGDIAGSGAGGSSFIAGYGGMKYQGPGKNRLGADITVTYYTGDKSIIDGRMASAVNEGNGYAKIELVSQASRDEKPQRKNTLLNNVQYIRDCTYGTSTDQLTASWLEIQASVNGTNVAAGKSVTSSGGSAVAGTSTSLITDSEISSPYTVTKTTGAEACVTVNLGSAYNLDEIYVLHKAGTAAESSQYKHRLTVSSNNSTWQTVKQYSDSNTESYVSVPEQTAGYRFTAWRLDNNTTTLQTGIYYIESAMSLNSRALTAANNNVGPTDDTGTSGRHVSLSTFKSSGVQKWAITKLSTGYYKIVEIESNNALQIKDSLGQAHTAVNTAAGYNDSYKWTHWNIIPLGDGTFRIQAREGSNYLSTINNAFYKDSDIEIAPANTTDATFTQRWRFEYALY